MSENELGSDIFNNEGNNVGNLEGLKQETKDLINKINNLYEDLMKIGDGIKSGLGSTNNLYLKYHEILNKIKVFLMMNTKINDGAINEWTLLNNTLLKEIKNLEGLKEKGNFLIYNIAIQKLNNFWNTMENKMGVKISKPSRKEMIFIIFNVIQFESNLDIIGNKLRAHGYEIFDFSDKYDEESNNEFYDIYKSEISSGTFFYIPLTDKLLIIKKRR